MSQTVLFLCTGNYFRSRYAEAIYNARAAARGRAGTAISRGLAVERGVKNVGPMATTALKRLAKHGVQGPALSRMPAAATRAELEGAGLIIALKEAEHRPLVTERWPAFVDRIEYWQVDDVDCCPAHEALDRIERLVDALLERA